MKVYNGQEDKEERQSKRTTSQLVLATGLTILLQMEMSTNLILGI
jgi:hypothetical protein